ncbi:MAG: C25 family peptidase propeptide domain-containing protein [Candidatus Helarchaeota archaeon]
MTNKKWLSISEDEKDITVIEEKTDEWGSITSKKCEFIKSETGDFHKITITYSMKGLWELEKEIADNKFSQIEIPDGGLMLDDPGSPQLPQEGLFIALPDNYDELEISVVETESKVYKLKSDLIPVPKPTRDATLIVEKGEIYDKDEFYPGVLYKNFGVNKIGNVKTLHLMIYPVQYNPKAQTIEVYSKIVLEIKYKEKEDETSKKFRGYPVKKRKKRVPRMFRDSLLNLENI